MKFKTVKLGDFVTITMGQSPKSEFYNTNGNGMPFLQGNRTFGLKYPNFDTYTTKVTKEAKAGDVIMSVRAPVGDLNITPVNMCLGRGVCSLRANNNNQNFLFYLMKYYMPLLLNKESGTVFGSVNKNDINNLEINLPPLETQKKIASILSALDDKIELNNKINENLEMQAQAIFDNMFPNVIYGEHSIGEYITPKRGKNLLSTNTIFGNVPVVAGGLEPSTYHNKSNTIAPVLTISASGANAGYVNLWTIPVWASDSSFIDFTMTENVYFWYVMLKKRQKEIFESQTGSAQPHIYPKHIAILPVIKLNQIDISKFTNIVTPLFNKIGNNKIENQRLAELRDTLLPKLMNGEIDVDDVQV